MEKVSGVHESGRRVEDVGRMPPGNVPFATQVAVCKGLLHDVITKQKAISFRTDPTHNPGYTAVIPKPMWLDLVAVCGTRAEPPQRRTHGPLPPSYQSKIEEKQYKTIGEFVVDMTRIFTNALRYNMHNGRLGICQQAVDLLKHFQTLYHSR